MPSRKGGCRLGPSRTTRICTPSSGDYPSGLAHRAPSAICEWHLSAPDVLATPGRRKAAVTHFLSFAPYYEDVILYGRPDELAWLDEHHFTVDFARGGLAIARFRACPAVLDLTPGPRGHSATIVSFGWSPAVEPTLFTSLPAARTDTPRSWPVRNSPCGDVWFRVLFDNDGDGRLSAGDGTCLEANGQGVVGARITTTDGHVACHAEQRLIPPADPALPDSGPRQAARP